MVKKSCSLLFLLFLVACSSMSGESYTECINVSASLVAGNAGETVVMVRGSDEEILLWTINTTLSRDEFDEAFLQGTYLSNDEIHELFEYYSDREMEGITLHIEEMTREYVTITRTYDYTVVDVSELSRIWGVDNFENTVSLSSAIASLEDQGAQCVTETVEVEDDEADEDED